MQIENEYGFVGGDLAYVRHLVNLAQGLLGKEAILYTTDPPPVVQKGSLPGDEVFTCVNFRKLFAAGSFLHQTMRFQLKFTVPAKHKSNTHRT